MKILLVNDNPVVMKLVTLSAQKTDDDVELIHSADDITGGDYDLLAVDDALYSDELFEQLKDKVHFKKSLFICSRESEAPEGFSSVLKKPFLPTDLVELFTSIEKNLPEEVEDNEEEHVMEELEDLDELNASEDLEDLQELDDLDLEEIHELDEAPSDDEFLLDDIDEDAIDSGESVLDDEEAQKVKDLLDEEYDMALDLEDEADVDISEGDTLEDAQKEIEEEIDFETALDLEDEADVDIAEDDVLEEDHEIENSDDELELEDLDGLSDDEIEDISLDDEVTLDEDELELDEIESEIENAVANLDEEELESEVDEETLLDIANSEINSLDELSSKDLKLALGEEISEEGLQEDEVDTVVDNKGVEGLKKLLEALSDKEVAASLKGAKITINISLGDE